MRLDGRIARLSERAALRARRSPTAARPREGFALDYAAFEAEFAKLFDGWSDEEIEACLATWTWPRPPGDGAATIAGAAR